MSQALTCDPMRRVAEKLLKSPTGVRATGEPYSLFMTIWINMQIHDWYVWSTAAEQGPSAHASAGVGN